VKTSS